jgi:hypothetical protein
MALLFTNATTPSLLLRRLDSRTFAAINDGGGQQQRRDDSKDSERRLMDEHVDKTSMMETGAQTAKTESLKKRNGGRSPAVIKARHNQG